MGSASGVLARAIAGGFKGGTAALRQKDELLRSFYGVMRKPVRRGLITLRDLTMGKQQLIVPLSVLRQQQMQL